MILTFDCADDLGKFEELYMKYRFLLYKIAFDMLGDTYLAEDAVQIAYVKIADKVTTIKGMSDVQTRYYLIQVVKNASIDIIRKRKRIGKKEVSLNEMETTLSYAPDFVDNLENRVFNALNRLPSKYKDVFTLKYSARLSDQQISKLLNISASAVRQRIARGKIKLQEELDKENF